LAGHRLIQYRSRADPRQLWASDKATLHQC
jgi:hypothetical protein